MLGDRERTLPADENICGAYRGIRRAVMQKLSSAVPEASVIHGGEWSSER